MKHARQTLWENGVLRPQEKLCHPDLQLDIHSYFVCSDIPILLSDLTCLFGSSHDFPNSYPGFTLIFCFQTLLFSKHDLPMFCPDMTFIFCVQALPSFFWPDIPFLFCVKTLLSYFFSRLDLLSLNPKHTFLFGKKIWPFYFLPRFDLPVFCGDACVYSKVGSTPGIYLWPRNTDGRELLGKRNTDDLLDSESF